jgi:hypothetical protein
MQSTSEIQQKLDRSSVLRIYGNGEILVEDTFQYLSALEEAYNGTYLFFKIVEEAEEISNFYGRQRPPIPIKNLLGLNWLPSDAEKVRSFVPKSDRLRLIGVELHSPGFWDFLGKLNPLEVLRLYLNDRHERQKDREYRNREEERELRIKNDELEFELLKKKYEYLKDIGMPEQNITLLKEQFLSNPSRQLDRFQDMKIIVTADLVSYDSD